MTGVVSDRDHKVRQAATDIFSLYFGARMAWLGGHMTLEAALEPESALALQIRGLRA